MKSLPLEEVKAELEAYRDRYGDTAVFSTIMQRWWEGLNEAKLRNALRILREEERMGNL